MADYFCSLETLVWPELVKRYAAKGPRVWVTFFFKIGDISNEENQ